MSPRETQVAHWCRVNGDPGGSSAGGQAPVDDAVAAAEVAAGGVAGEGAVADRQRPGVVDAAAGTPSSTRSRGPCRSPTEKSLTPDAQGWPISAQL